MEQLFTINRHPKGPVAEAYEIIGQALDLYKPSKIFGLFSGGHDSLCSTMIASQFKVFAAAVHINTGIGVEQTREFVRETCREMEWPLIELRSKYTYESLVLRFGFPGPAGHGVMYRRLKERCLRQLIREHKTHLHDRILLVGGMRLEESTRRMGNAEPHSREGCRVWCAPLLHWTNEDKNRYIENCGLNKNSVVGKLCMSGECLCGAFARPNEMVELEYHFPDMAQRIHALEAEAKSAGVHCRWGTRPPAKEKNNPEQPTFYSLCWGCGNKGG